VLIWIKNTGSSIKRGCGSASLGAKVVFEWSGSEFYELRCWFLPCKAKWLKYLTWMLTLARCSGPAGRLTIDMRKRLFFPQAILVQSAVRRFLVLRRLQRHPRKVERDGSSVVNVELVKNLIDLNLKKMDNHRLSVEGSQVSNVIKTFSWSWTRLF